MTRPQIIRADTLDLQDPDAPSAQDHTHQPTHPAPLGVGPAAPHQDASLRHVAQERHAEQDYMADAWGSEPTDNDHMEIDDEESGELLNGSANDQLMHQNGEGAGSIGSPEMTHDDDEQMDDEKLDQVSSSPSIDNEDIDFEFVYALHTFVATVEGQANATKGDTMVLLDDSNSYWWLVRVVKDASIGYLPAEHIETPTERLARLNKHRNIDLSAAMLSDTYEKSKNPLKKAMRRRNAKVVQFTTPTYFEPDDFSWSDVDDPGDIDDLDLDIKDRRNEHYADRESFADESGSNLNGDIQAQGGNANGELLEGRSGLDRDSLVEEMFEQQGVMIPTRSRNGTIRNTDSFFKDDTAEPRKISLTPNLLRDDSSIGSGRSSESREKSNSQDGLEQPDKANPPAEKAKDEKKKREKKPGMLSGLFKKKDRRLKVDEAGGLVPKAGSDVSSAPLSPGSSGRASPIGAQAQKRITGNGKLTKSPPPTISTAPTPGFLGPADAAVNGVVNMAVENPQPSPLRPKPPGAFPSETSITTGKPLAIDQSPPSQSTQFLPLDIPSPNISEVTDKPRSESNGNAGILSPLTTLFSSNNEQPKREQLKKVKQRVDLDIDPSPEAETAPELAYSLSPHDPSNGTSPVNRKIETGPPERTALQPTTVVSEPAQAYDDYEDELVSPLEGSFEMHHDRQPPSLVVDTLSHNKQSSSPVSAISPVEIPEPTRRTYDVESKSSTETSNNSTLSAPESVPLTEDNTVSSVATARTATTPPPIEQAPRPPLWDDASLRAYLEKGSDSDVKDLFLLVQDKTGVVPVGRDHPIMMDCFDAQKKQLDDISLRLDGLLHGFLARTAAKVRNGTLR